MRLRMLFFLLITVFSSPSFSQTIPFPSVPDWQSTPLNHYATGLGVADINGDGWEDIIVANGNDMARQHLVVYYNNGDGTFPLTPSWSSQDVDYHGHLAVGDINGDGWNDVAVSTFLGPAGFNELGWVKVYFNQEGFLEGTPSFQTADHYFTFSCALGDADGDGDLDLAVAGGQPYNLGLGPFRTPGRIYFNDNGTLNPQPGWLSADSLYALDVEFADIDQNGFLDLAFANHYDSSPVYFADSIGQISSTAGWRTADVCYGNSLVLARVSPDVYPDLVLSDNFQLGGSGKFKLYVFNGPSGQDSSVDWSSLSGGYGSGVFVADVDGDLLADFLGGRWWSPLYIFLGNSVSYFSNLPNFTSVTNSVIEAIEMRDLDHDGLQTGVDTFIVQYSPFQVFTLSQAIVSQLISVRRNGQVLPRQEYAWVPGKNWVSLKPILQPGDTVIVEYLFSLDNDIVISNWDPGLGNYIFYNTTNPVGIAHSTSSGATDSFLLFGPFPNPFNSSTRFRMFVQTPGEATVTLHNLLGQKVMEIPLQLHAGWNQMELTLPQNFSSGLYFYQVYSSERRKSGRLMLLR